MHETSVFLKPHLDQVLLDRIDEPIVEESINHEINDFFAPIPDIVDLDILWRDLKASRDPDTIHGDVDSCNCRSDSILQKLNSTNIGVNDSNSINNNLQKELDLEGPAGH